MVIINKKFLFTFLTVLTLSMLLAACGDDAGTEADNGAENDTGETENTEDTNEGNGDEAASEFENATWRMITEEVDGQVQYEYAEEFANRINDKTDGAITIEPYEYGQLGSEVDQVNQLEQGAVELAVMSPGFTGNMVTEGQLFSLHFLFPADGEQTQEILNTSDALNTDLRERYEEHGISPLAYWTEGFMAWTSNVGIEEPSDFDGLNMRIQETPLMQETYSAYGATTQSMSQSELYTALDRGTIDAQENPIFYIYDMSFQEVQDTVTLSRHNSYIAMTTVNTDWYNGLDENVQAVIDETVEEMQDWIYEEQDRQNTEYLELMQEEEGMEVIELTEDQRQAFRDEALSVHDYYREELSEVDGAILDQLEEEIAEVTGE
ncbi:TRAP transporter substrate-binding protein DctP [Aquibacillus sediminis]|uniref:TRAP transporter substrate-binding protein DctP n=1 Tax=Aquibacillus sediminis TaxID=2574734 RepID=UPI001107BACB|nr:TRAP transporter substrate-binding protein DctP [Aquibacillus sediminis]